MEALSTNKPTLDSINVFLIGNNPIELSNIYEKLKEIKNKTYNTEIGFDLKGVYKRIMKFNPTCILIDDNLEKPYLRKLLDRLSKDTKTRNIPITIIKNSNYSSSYLGGVQDFILKDGITAESLSKTILRSIKLKNMQQFIYLSYKKKRGQVLSFFNN